MARVVVIGGGAAGLSAALDLDRRGHDVTVLEADAEPVPTTRSAMWEERFARSPGGRNVALGTLKPSPTRLLLAASAAIAVHASSWGAPYAR